MFFANDFLHESGMYVFSGVIISKEVNTVDLTPNPEPLTHKS